MRTPHQSSSRVSTAPNAFAPAFLARVQNTDDPLTAAEADLAGPWKLEPLHPDQGWPGAVAVLRAWESLDQGDQPEAIFLHQETAALCAVLLPLIEREPLFQLHEDPTPNAPLSGGYPVTATYGEQGTVVRGWLRRYHPEIQAALHLLESLVRNPGLLAEVTAVAGGTAITHLGRALAEKHPG